MAKNEHADEIVDRLAKVEERLVLTTGQATFAAIFAAAIMRELNRSGTLDRDIMTRFLANAFTTIKDHREILSEQEKPGYDIAFASVSSFFGSGGPRR